MSVYDKLIIYPPAWLLSWIWSGAIWKQKLRIRYAIVLIFFFLFLMRTARYYWRFKAKLTKKKTVFKWRGASTEDGSGKDGSTNEIACVFFIPTIWFIIESGQYELLTFVFFRNYFFSFFSLLFHPLNC